MKKVYRLENLGCASCASKMGEEISKIEGVNSAKVNFMLSKLTIEVDSKEDLPSKESLSQVIRSIENYCSIA
ncbi:cation transporter [Rhodovulum adriaticum]|uniref:cation transporter n=1 Tax=Rhodovulum adriaticum TaxID=35804 RepID=UPI001905DD8A|nr:heavy-metal-associated domain-containing protein [Rhodovulum adriaticum]MBK1637428.1 heavy metal transporter [Rhodovulum adriaticum]